MTLHVEYGPKPLFALASAFAGAHLSVRDQAALFVEAVQISSIAKPRLALSTENG